MAYDLEFEKPLAELEKKIHALQRKGDRLKPDELAQLQALEKELSMRTEEIYKQLTPWQTVQVARHRSRPYALDYIKLICDDFFELHGDRSFGDDHAIVGGQVPAVVVAYVVGTPMESFNLELGIRFQTAGKSPAGRFAGILEIHAGRKDVGQCRTGFQKGGHSLSDVQAIRVES